jgi:hypothetical protein
MTAMVTTFVCVLDDDAAVEFALNEMSSPP